jgi:hypothetical protein
LHVGKPFREREEVWAGKGWGGGDLYRSWEREGLYLLAVLVNFRAISHGAVFLTDGCLFAMENIFFWFLFEKNRTGKRSY